MLCSLRRKFILIAMPSLLGTMAVLCAAIGVGNYYAATNRMDRAISLLRQNGGSFLHSDSRSDPSYFRFQVTPEPPFETRYFMVELTEQREVRSVNLDHIAALDRRTAVDTISRIIDAGKERGDVDYYRFGIFRNNDGSSTVIVLNGFLQIQAANNMM